MRQTLSAVLLVCVACSQQNANMNAEMNAVQADAGKPRGAPTATDSSVHPAAAGSGGSAPAQPPRVGTSPVSAGSSASAGTAAPGAAAMAGAGAGAAAAGGAGAAAQPAAGSSSNTAEGCTRELLQTSTDAYYTALAAHDPAMLPSIDKPKFTENGKPIELGEGLWKTAGMLKYKHSALDIETCSSVSESVVPDGSMDVPVGLRLKLDQAKISEIETIVVRPGDYKVFGSSFPSNTDAIAASRDRVKWEEVVPEDQRASRAMIQEWLGRYFRLFPRAGCNFADDCQRLENGGGSFECSAALSCEMAAMPSDRGTLIPRTFVIDVERGIGVGFTLFMGNTDFHMIKMYGAEIHAVHAVLGAASSSGWE